MSPLAVRQRIVSEAALRLLTPGRPPLVVVLPSTWAPTSSAGFWDGLDLDWLHLTTVDAIAAQQGRDVDPDRLVYPETQRLAELDAADFTSATDLARAGDTLQNLLTLNDQVGGVVRDEAMTDLSYATRRQPLTSPGVGVAVSRLDRGPAELRRGDRAQGRHPLQRQRPLLRHRPQRARPAGDGAARRGDRPAAARHGARRQRRDRARAPGRPSCSTPRRRRSASAT